MKIGISIGDAFGIGPEVIVKAVMDPRILQDCTPIIFAPAKLISQIKKSCDLPDLNFQVINKAKEAQVRKVNVVNYPNEAFQMDEGKAGKGSAELAIWSLTEAVKAFENNDIDAIVTGPVSKELLQVNGFEFPGHTEFFESKLSDTGALMILCAGNLRVALATNHIAIKEIPTVLNKDLIVSKLMVLNNSLKLDFGIQRPKIAVLGLNPHSGENGKIGEEELEIISPAISAAKGQNILAFGPYSSDGFFGSKSCFEFDAVLAMFHDQGLTGFKAIAFDEGVNFTAGLLVVRTSPGHGTAFDLAGKNLANEQAMRNAIYLAIDATKQRQFNKEVIMNQLPISKGTRETEGSS